jgi:hypothetical protein
MNDEDAVRTLLRESDIPETRLDVGGLMADGRRSRRRRRVGRVAGAGLAVVAMVAAVVPAVVVRNRVTAPEQPAGDVATTTRVVNRAVRVGGAPGCVRTPLPAPMAGSYGVQAGDDAGERIVAVNFSFTRLTLWTRGEPTLFDWPALRAPRATVTAVNSGGTVVGYDPADPVISYLYRDGVVHTLAKPDGFHQAVVVDVNERGDALGTLSPPGRPDDRRALVVWPADGPDRPRVIAEAGLTPVGIRDDGTVVALRTGERRSPIDTGDAVVVHRPDGTRLEVAAPPGFDVPGSLEFGVVRGDLLFTTQATGRTVEFRPGFGDPVVRPVSRPVLWNLRTGVVEVFDDVYVESRSSVASSGGWFTATTYEGGVADVAVGPGGAAYRLPAEARVNWIGVDGSTIAGYFEGAPVTWRCPR